MCYSKHLTCLFLFFIVLVACNKLDYSPTPQTPVNKDVTTFFTAHPASNTTIQALANFVQTKNKTTNFLQQIVNNNGVAHWDKAVLASKNNRLPTNSNGDSTEVYYIPIAQPNTEIVNASLNIITTPTDTTIGFSFDWEYRNTSNTTTSINDPAEKVAVFFMRLNNSTFGITKYKITDTALFRGNGKIPVYVTISQPNGNGSGANGLLQYEECTYVTIYYEDCPYDPGDCKPDGSCDGCPSCLSSLTWEYCTTIGGGGGGGTTGGTGTTTNGNTNTSGGGGGTTGGTGWTPSPSTIAQANTIKTILSLNPAQTSWLTQNPIRTQEIFDYLEENVSTENINFTRKHLNEMINNANYLNFVAQRPNYIEACYSAFHSEFDDTNISNPCLKSIVTAMKNMDYKGLYFDLFKSMHSLKLGGPIKVVFNESTSLPNERMAATQESIAKDPVTNEFLKAIITLHLNVNKLPSRSKEFVSSIVLHEICHGLLRSIALASGNTVLTPLEEHQAIANNYLSPIFNNLEKLYTTNSNELRALSIGGLHMLFFDANGILLNNQYTQKVNTTFPGLDIDDAYYNVIQQHIDRTKGIICN
jgi:hypothetical protein